MNKLKKSDYYMFLSLKSATFFSHNYTSVVKLTICRLQYAEKFHVLHNCPNNKTSYKEL